ncbi:hypothetical protein [Jiella pelagia]|nr:hypothetical protein [Jiella pelagia]
MVALPEWRHSRSIRAAIRPAFDPSGSLRSLGEQPVDLFLAGFVRIGGSLRLVRRRHVQIPVLWRGAAEGVRGSVGRFVRRRNDHWRIVVARRRDDVRREFAARRRRQRRRRAVLCGGRGREGKGKRQSEGDG